MNQQKIGSFLKELRKQKGVTQEQVAELFHVSNRTVSRWENGYNMPDLDVLIEISDYYQVELRELLDGERKGTHMDKETEEIVLKAVDYTSTKTERQNKRVRRIFFIGMIAFFISQVISRTTLAEIPALCNVSDFAAGLTCGAMIAGCIMASRFGLNLSAFKRRLLARLRKNPPTQDV